MDTISTVGTKRDLESDDEDPDGDIPSKRQHIKKTEGQSTTELATITQADPNLRGQPVQGAEESSIMYVEEPWQDSLDFPLESSQRNVPDGGDRGQDIMKYLENMESPLSSPGDQSQNDHTGVGLAEFYHQLKLS